MAIGSGFTTGQYCRIEAADNCTNARKVLTIGTKVEINDSCHIAAIGEVSIGDNVLIASHVYISDHDHGTTSSSQLRMPPSQRELTWAPVHIEDDVWIGERVVILKGVTIGKGSVIGAGAVVTKSIPPYSIAVGIPAAIIKSSPPHISPVPTNNCNSRNLRHP